MGITVVFEALWFRAGSKLLSLVLAVLLVAASTVVVNPTAEADTFFGHDAVVSEHASFAVPDVLDGTVEAIAVVGDTVVVGGSFTQVRSPGGPILDMPYLFAFSKSTGQIDMAFDPVMDNEVWTLSAGSDDLSVFVGGKFTTVNGQFNKQGLTKLDLFGDRITAFSGRTNGRVKDMVLLGGILYIGGSFTKVKSTPVENLAAVNATTGNLLPKLDFDFADPYSAYNKVTDKVVVGSLSVDELDVTPDGTTLVIAGNFSLIDGVEKSRLVVIDLAPTPATLRADWDTSVFDVQCDAGRFPQYIFGLDISPDGSYFVTGTAGGYTDGNVACDTIARWELNQTGLDIRPAWAVFTGGDSVYEVAVSGEAVYAGGHFRWLNNGIPRRNDLRGPGSVNRRGLAALDPLNGLPLSWRSDRSPRGLGTFELLVDDGGLWVGDDTEFLNGAYHPRLKFLPLAGGSAVERPEKPVLPTTVFSIDNSSLDAEPFDGTTFGTSTELASGPDWGEVRGMVALSGALFYAQADDTFWVRNLDGPNVGQRISVNLNGLTGSVDAEPGKEFRIGTITGMYFDHDRGRLYYTLTDKPDLYYRYFTPESQLIGSREFVAGTAGGRVPWQNVRGMDRVDDQLYFGLTDGNLRRVDLDPATSLPVAGTNLLLSGLTVDGRDWSGPAMTFLSPGDVLGPPPAPLADFEFAGSGTATQDSWRRFEFPVALNEDVSVQLDWDDPTAAVNVFLFDETGAVVVSDNTAVGSPKLLTTNAKTAGEWSVAVKIKQGETDYDVLVDTVPGPPPLADFEFAGSGSATQDSWKVFKFPIYAGQEITATVDWDDPAAAVNLFLRDETGATVAGNNSAIGTPKTIVVEAASTGQWSVAVKIKEGETDYDVLVDAFSEAPPPLDEFEFAGSGTDILDSWQVFKFPVIAGQEFFATFEWDDPGAEVYVFVRDETGTTIVNDRTANGSPKTLSTAAATTGDWAVAVKIKQGATAFTILVAPPEP